MYIFLGCSDYIWSPRGLQQTSRTAPRPVWWSRGPPRCCESIGYVPTMFPGRGERPQTSRGAIQVTPKKCTLYDRKRSIKKIQNYIVLFFLKSIEALTFPGFPEILDFELWWHSGSLETPQDRSEALGNTPGHREIRQQVDAAC